MKRTLPLVLAAILLFLSGCQAVSGRAGDENPGIPSSGPTLMSPDAPVTPPAPVPTAELYYRVYSDLVSQYGEAEVVTNHEYEYYSFLKGVCVAELLDFDGDGAQELFVIYSNGQYTGRHQSNIRNDEHDVIIPQAGAYEIEVWAVKEGRAVQLLHHPSVGSYRSFNTEYWDTDNCLVTVYENPDGIPVIQLYDASKKGVAYTNISWDRDGFAMDELHYCNGSYALDGESITEETWDGHITGYDTILFLAQLSSSSWIVDYSGIMNRTGDVVQALSQNQKPVRPKPVQNGYIPLYLKEIDRSNRERADLEYAFPTDYCLYDIDRNGTPELLIKNGICEADYYYAVFTVVDGEIVRCGEFSGFHTSLWFGRRLPGLVRYSGHMMTYTIEFISLEDTELKVEAIADDFVDMDHWDKGYPELDEFGYAAYDQPLPDCYVTTPLELYMYGHARPK